MKNTFQKGLSTVNCQLSTCIFFFLFILGATAQSQSDPRLDSLENAIRHAEGPGKADLMMESLNYQYNNLGLHHDKSYLEELISIYRYAKNIGYFQGIAESAMSIGSSFTSIPDSARIYLNEALHYYLVLDDTLNVAAIYGSMAKIESLAGNHERTLHYLKMRMELIQKMNDMMTLLSAYDGDAETYKAIGMFSEEEECYQKMLFLQNSIGNNPSRTLIYLARYHINHGNYKEGIRYSLKADSSIGELQDASSLEYKDKTFMQAKMKGNVARAYRLWGYYDSALVWHRRAIAEMNLSPEHAGVDIPNQWEGIGYIYIQKGIYDSARLYLEKSANIRYELRDFLGAGESYDGLGYLCWLLGDEAAAVKYYADAIEMKSRVEKTVGHYRWVTLLESQSVSSLQLGKVYASWGMQESAMQNLEQSIALCREIGFRTGEAEALIEIGKLLGIAGNKAEAEKVFNEALQIFSEIDFKPGQADAISAMGDLFFLAKEFHKSLDFYNQSQDILLQAQNPMKLADVWIRTGKVLGEIKQYDRSEEYFLKALEMTGRFKLFRRNMEANQALAGLYANAGNFSKALDCYSRFLAKRDSVNQQKTFYLLADLQLKHEAELNQRQLELLEMENQVKNLSLARSNSMLIGTFGIILLLILLAITVFRTLKLKEARRKALLQQRLLRTRMGPGFISASLGNIKELVSESKTVEASDYITYFSRMMQVMLEGSRQELIVFRKGIAMLKSYFEMMKLNLRGSFDYQVYVDEGIDQDQTMVPSFLEEVIIPEYKSEPANRSIKITFSGMEHTMLVSVESRGVVADSSGLSDQEIKALKMVQKRLLDMEKKYNVKLNFSIAELFDESGRPDGKKLEFTLPVVLE